jgi:hypothetical protein
MGKMGRIPIKKISEMAPYLAEALFLKIPDSVVVCIRQKMCNAFLDDMLFQLVHELSAKTLNLSHEDGGHKM